MDGFEHGIATPVANGGQYWIVNGTLSVQSTTKFTGNYALRTNPAGAALGYVSLGGINGAGVAKANVALNVTDLYLSFRFKVDTLPAANGETFLRLVSVAPAQKCKFMLNSDGTISLYNAANTLISTTSLALATGTWYVIQVSCGSGGITIPVVLKVNGSTQISTTIATSTNHQRVEFGKAENNNNNSVDFYYDDIIMDTANFWGPRIYPMAINGASSPHQWTSGTAPTDYTTCDDTPPHNNDTDYVGTSTALSQFDSYFLHESTTSALIPANYDILGVVVAGWARYNGTVSQTRFAVNLKSNATTISTTGAALNNSTYIDTEIYALTDPNTSAAWTRSGLDAATVGITRLSETTFARAARCTQVMMYVCIHVPLNGPSSRGYIID